MTSSTYLPKWYYGDVLYFKTVDYIVVGMHPPCRFVHVYF